MKHDLIERMVARLIEIGCTKVFIDQKPIPRIKKYPSLLKCIDLLKDSGTLCIPSIYMVASNMDAYMRFIKQLEKQGISTQIVKWY
ncbi:MAG: hypothetical protein ACRCXT_00560 [Paraclostridium sp.]